MQPIVPQLRDLVLVGGGHAHALILRRWGMAPMAGVRLSVIDPTPVTAYSGMLPGVIAGHYPRAALDIDLVRLCRHAGARLIIGAATALDPEARRITVPGRAPVAYDLVSLDIGVTSQLPDLPGFSAHGTPAKPLGALAERWSRFLEQVRTGLSRPRVAVIGGGIAGVELALAMTHRLDGLGAAPVEMTLIERDRVLSGTTPHAARRLRERLQAAGITLLEQAEPRALASDGVTLVDGRRIAADMVVAAAGARPAPWLAQSGLAHEAGFVSVGSDLRSLSHPSVFAAGDCAHLSAAPRPKAGVFAVRAAPVLDHNLRATLAGCATRAFHPQRSYLKLVSLGPKSALAQKGPLALEGRWMWRWKDHIDRRFMDKLQNLPPMAPARATTAMAPALAAELPQEQPLCGGCGSKVGPGALASALADLPAPPLSATLQGDGLLTGPGDDAAILRSASGYQVISTDHLRAVVEDPEVMARIALYHAMGDVWAMGAQPQLALAQIILPRMSDPLQARALGEITSASTAACAALGAVLAGGHSTMGAELTIGFTVTGTSSQPPILKAGAKPGDILLLTRPIGSGTLLAGEMQKQASGYWISALLNTLCTPQAREAAVLASMAHAMTDVTGFGLAGHALEMAQASGCGVVLDLDDIPLFPGASELSARGIRSTIHDANRAACLPWLESGTERCPLLHDPQTCGGLLAALEPRAAIEAVAQIAAAGGRAWSVGQITEGPARLRLR